MWLAMFALYSQRESRLARALISLLVVTMCFAQTSVYAQSFSARQQATPKEQGIGGPQATSPALSSAIPSWWTVASRDTSSPQSAGRNSESDLVAGAENAAASRRGAFPSVSRRDRVDPQETAASLDRDAWWRATEVHFQYGKLEAPTFAGGQSSDTQVLTFQHRSEWEYGDNFFFMDLYNDGVVDGFNDNDVYLEWYPNFSLGKILGRRVGFGRISDVGVLAGINYGADVNFLKWLPGLRFSWDLPGFAFFNTDFTAFIDDNAGIQSGGIPATTSTFMVDVNWALPFSIGAHDFSIEGHAEFIGDRRNELGDRVSWWFLAQPQFRYDAGKTLFGRPDKLFVGIEWQIWINKFGDAQTDENTLQALVVWRF